MSIINTPITKKHAKNISNYAYDKYMMPRILAFLFFSSQVRVWDARGGEKSGLAHLVPAHVLPNGSGAVGDIVLTGDRAESYVFFFYAHFQVQRLRRCR
jgi:hypothetical protein